MNRSPSPRILACTTLFLCLLLVLESGRASPMLERDFHPALARVLTDIAERSGFAELSAAQRAAVERWNSPLIVGAVAPETSLASAPDADNSAGSGMFAGAAPPQTAAEKLAATSATSAHPAPPTRPTESAPDVPSVPETGQNLLAQNDPAFRNAVNGDQNPPRQNAPAGLSSATPLPIAPSEGSDPSTSVPATSADAVPAVSPDLAPAVSPAAPQDSLPGVPQDAAPIKPKVLIVGDSLIMEGFGPVLQRQLRARNDVTVIREGKYSTGLTRTDQFDWPLQLEELVARHDPDIILVCLGANDPQDIIDADRKRHIAGSESWQALYRERAERFVRAGTARGASMIWVGLPIMGLPTYDGRVRLLSGLQEAACLQQEGGCTFVSNRKTLAGPAGEYLTYQVDAAGKHIRLRYKDKIHVTEDGGKLMVARLLPFFEKVLAQPPRSTNAPVAVPAPVPDPATAPDTASHPVQMSPAPAPGSDVSNP